MCRLGSILKRLAERSSTPSVTIALKQERSVSVQGSHLVTRNSSSSNQAIRDRRVRTSPLRGGRAGRYAMGGLKSWSGRALVTHVPAKGRGRAEATTSVASGSDMIVGVYVQWH